MCKEAVAVRDTLKRRWFLIGLIPWLGSLLLAAAEAVRSQNGTVIEARSMDFRKKQDSDKIGLGTKKSDVKVLSVNSSRQSWTLPLNNSRDGWLVAVGMTSTKPGKFPVSLQTKSTSRVALETDSKWISDYKPSHKLVPSEAAIQQINSSKSLVNKVVTKKYPVMRTFAIQTQSGDSNDLAYYEMVEAKLRKVGQKVVVYVDQRDLLTVSDQTVSQIIEIVDKDLPTHVISRIGQARDTDGDGRLTIVLSQALSRIGNGTVVLDGFVRPSDFASGGTFPRSHSCDMIYLNSRVSDWPFLKSLLAHEYTHAVVASNRMMTDVDLAEESWLDEGLAHLAERWVDGSWDNLDYRISAFLHASQDFKLIVDDQNGLRESREHGHRGAAFLFLSWCESVLGPELPRRLVQSSEVGLKNLEQVTGKTIEELFRGWSVDLMERSASLGEAEQIRSQALLNEWLVGTPQATVHEVVANDQESVQTSSWQANGTTVRLFRVIPKAGMMAEPGALELTIHAPLEAGVQVTAMSLRDRHHGLQLELLEEPDRAEISGHKRTGYQLRFTNLDQDRPLKIQAAGWEILANQVDARRLRQHRGFFDVLGLSRLTGSVTLKPGQTLRTGPIWIDSLPDLSTSIAWRVVAHDLTGRPEFASAQLGLKPINRITPQLAGEVIGDAPKVLRR
jgi:hypothetical protein